jgi:hypothetical protein
MADITKAFDVGFKGIALGDDDVMVFAGADDPSSVGEAAPVGSLYLRAATSEHYVKYDTADTDWDLMVRRANSGGLPLSASRRNNTTNQYLDTADGTPTNLVPFIVPVDAELVAMSLSTDGAESWTAEVHVSEVLKTGAILTVTSSNTAFDNTYTGINFTAGDELSLYCNGTNISKPQVIIVIRQTG